MTDTHATAARQQGKQEIVVYRERFEMREAELKTMLPPGISADRFIRAATTAAQLNPEILACSWKSIWDSTARACRAGLLPDGVHSAFVPYKGTCTFLPMVRGVVSKFYEVGSARWVTANCVYEGDQFEHWIDEHGEHLRHTPSDTFDDKKILRVYAMATTKDGGVFLAVMSRAEVDKHRGFSRTKREDAPWVMHYSEMAKKTVLHRLAKLMPTAPSFEDEPTDEDEDEPPQLTSVPRPAGAAAALDMFAGSPDDGSPADDAGPDARQAEQAAADKPEPDAGEPAAADDARRK
jgi:recombination protein RecT